MSIIHKTHLITYSIQEKLKSKAKLIQLLDIKKKTERTMMKLFLQENRSMKHLKLKLLNLMMLQLQLMMHWPSFHHLQTHHCYKLEDSKIHLKTLKIRLDQDPEWHQ
jgi:hypothetical protein